ncbi:monooxygenase [Cyathus striatus]|nr:monooxygenase [Cyathus striatus]
MSTSASVLVVGAGPSGLILALSLLQNGVSVRIIEKEVSHRVGERGAGIMPRTFEVHNLLGTLPDILNSATSVPPRRVYEFPGGTKVITEDNMMPYIEPAYHTPYANPMALGQNYQEEILRKHLKKYGVEVELATTLEKFEQYDDHVAAHLLKLVEGNATSEIVNYAYLVGADGAHSTIRKKLGLSFLGECIQEAYMKVGDIEMEESLDRKFWHFWGEPRSKMVFIRPSGQDPDVYNFIVSGDDSLINVTATSGRENLIQAIEEITGRKDLVFKAIRWISNYRPNVRMVDKFHVNRVFLAGDAAHCHSPAGGQGMNSSSQDAFNLGWKLALVAKGLAPPSLLDSYDEERLPVIAEMLNLTTKLYKTTRNASTKEEQAASWKRGTEFHMFSVNYRTSSFVIDDGASGEFVGPAYNPESATAARAGDRAPDAPELQLISPVREEKSLFQIFGSSNHTVLVFGGSTEEHNTVLEKLAVLPKESVKSVLVCPANKPDTVIGGFDVVLVDTKGYALEGYHIPKEGLHVVIVRPDGVVGARLTVLENLNKYFSKIFL